MKKFLKIVLLLVIVASTCAYCFAAASLSLEISTTQGEYDKGTSGEAIISIKNVKDVDPNYPLRGALLRVKGDSNVTIKSIESLNGWSSPMYNEENGKVVVDHTAGVTSDSEFLKVKFDINENASGDGKITLSEINFSGGNGDIFPSNVECTVKLKSVVPPISNEPENKPQEPAQNKPVENNPIVNEPKNEPVNTPTNKPVNNPVNTPKNESGSNNTVNNNTINTANTVNNTINNVVNKAIISTTNTTSNVGIPKAGTGSVVLMLIGALVSAMAYFVIRMKLIDKKVKKL